jgi:hypothetical protein
MSLWKVEGFRLATKRKPFAKEVKYNPARGSTRDHKTNSPTGTKQPGRPGILVTTQWIAAIEVRLIDGHKGTRKRTTIACRAPDLTVFQGGGGRRKSSKRKGGRATRRKKTGKECAGGVLVKVAPTASEWDLSPA